MDQTFHNNPNGDDDDNNHDNKNNHSHHPEEEEKAAASAGAISATSRTGGGTTMPYYYNNQRTYDGAAVGGGGGNMNHLNNNNNNPYNYNNFLNQLYNHAAMYGYYDPRSGAYLPPMSYYINQQQQALAATQQPQQQHLSSSSTNNTPGEFPSLLNALDNHATGTAAAAATSPNQNINRHHQTAVDAAVKQTALGIVLADVSAAGAGTTTTTNTGDENNNKKRKADEIITPTVAAAAVPQQEEEATTTTDNKDAKKKEKRQKVPSQPVKLQVAYSPSPPPDKNQFCNRCRYCICRCAAIAAPEAAEKKPPPPPPPPNKNQFCNRCRYCICRCAAIAAEAAEKAPSPPPPPPPRAKKQFCNKCCYCICRCGAIAAQAAEKEQQQQQQQQQQNQQQKEEKPYKEPAASYLEQYVDDESAPDFYSNARCVIDMTIMLPQNCPYFLEKKDDLKKLLLGLNFSERDCLSTAYLYFLSEIGWIAAHLMYHNKLDNKNKHHDNDNEGEDQEEEEDNTNDDDDDESNATPKEFLRCECSIIDEENIIQSLQAIMHPKHWRRSSIPDTMDKMIPGLPKWYEPPHWQEEATKPLSSQKELVKYFCPHIYPIGEVDDDILKEEFKIRDEQQKKKRRKKQQQQQQHRQQQKPDEDDEDDQQQIDNNKKIQDDNEEDYDNDPDGLIRSLAQTGCYAQNLIPGTLIGFKGEHALTCELGTCLETDCWTRSKRERLDEYLNVICTVGSREVFQQLTPKDKIKIDESLGMKGYSDLPKGLDTFYHNLKGTGAKEFDKIFPIPPRECRLDVCNMIPYLNYALDDKLGQFSYGRHRLTPRAAAILTVAVSAVLYKTYRHHYLGDEEKMDATVKQAALGVSAAIAPAAAATTTTTTTNGDNSRNRKADEIITSPPPAAKLPPGPEPAQGGAVVEEAVFDEENKKDSALTSKEPVPKEEGGPIPPTSTVKTVCQSQLMPDALTAAAAAAAIAEEEDATTPTPTVEAASELMPEATTTTTTIIVKEKSNGGHEKGPEKLQASGTGLPSDPEQDVVMENVVEKCSSSSTSKQQLPAGGEDSAPTASIEPVAEKKDSTIATAVEATSDMMAPSRASMEENDNSHCSDGEDKMTLPGTEDVTVPSTEKAVSSAAASVDQPSHGGKLSKMTPGPSEMAQEEKNSQQSRSRCCIM